MMIDEDKYKIVEQVKRTTGCPARWNNEKEVVEVYQNGKWVQHQILTEG